MSETCKTQGDLGSDTKLIRLLEAVHPLRSERVKTGIRSHLGGRRCNSARGEIAFAPQQYLRRLPERCSQVFIVLLQFWVSSLL